MKAKELKVGYEYCVHFGAVHTHRMTCTAPCVLDGWETLRFDPEYEFKHLTEVPVAKFEPTKIERDVATQITLDEIRGMGGVKTIDGWKVGNIYINLHNDTLAISVSAGMPIIGPHMVNLGKPASLGRFTMLKEVLRATVPGVS